MKSNFSKFFLLFPILCEYLLILISYWPIHQLIALSLGSPERLCIRAQFNISLCTEKGILNATETAVCKLSEFYWCSRLLLTMNNISICLVYAIEAIKLLKLQNFLGIFLINHIHICIRSTCDQIGILLKKNLEQEMKCYLCSIICCRLFIKRQIFILLLLLFYFKQLAAFNSHLKLSLQHVKHFCAFSNHSCICMIPFIEVSYNFIHLHFAVRESRTHFNYRKHATY